MAHILQRKGGLHWIALTAVKVIISQKSICLPTGQSSLTDRTYTGTHRIRDTLKRETEKENLVIKNSALKISGLVPASTEDIHLLLGDCYGKGNVSNTSCVLAPANSQEFPRLSNSY